MASSQAIPAGRALLLVAQAGQRMVEGGAEVSRVEATMERMMAALGYPGAQSFVTPTGLFLSAGSGSGGETILRRIRYRQVDLGLVGQVHALAWELEWQPGPARWRLLEERLAALERRPPQRLLWAVLAGAMAASAATVLVGGTTQDVFPAFLANLVVQFLWRGLGRSSLADFLRYLVAGATAVLMAQLLRTWWPGLHAGLVVAGGLMTLVPGVAFTAFLQDAMAGDLVSASARGLEALLAAAGLVLGATGGLFLVRDFLPIQVARVGWVPLATSAGFAMLLAFGSAVGFRVPSRAWLPAALAGGMVWWVFVLVVEGLHGTTLAIFAAGVVLGLVAHLFARAFRLPTTCFVVPGFIPLVPGVTIYRAILAGVEGDALGSLRLLADGLLAAGALAAGLALGAALVAGVRGDRAGPVGDRGEGTGAR